MKKTVFSLIAAAAAATIYGANLVPGDTSFETEPDTLTSGRVAPSHLPFAWDDKEAYHGKRSLRIDWDRKNRLFSFGVGGSYWLDKHIGFDTENLENGKPYVLSFYAKAKEKGATIGVMLHPNADWEYFTKNSVVVRHGIPLTSEWTRITIPFTPRYKDSAPIKGYTCLFRFREAKAGTYWIDAVQVEPGGKATPYQPSAPMECGIVLDVPPGRGEIRRTLWAAYYPGDKITGTLRLHSNDGKSGKLTVRTIDWLGRTVSEFTRDDVKEEVIPLTFDSNRRGWFKATATLTRGGREIRQHIANFIVIDRPVETAPGVEPFFGMITDYSFHMLPLMKRIGVKGVQVAFPWKTSYNPGMEPQKGKYDFRSLDLQIGEAVKYGMKVKLAASFIRPPEWYFTPEVLAEVKKFPPSDQGLVSRASMEGWKRRVNALLERYADKIDCIELGGEDDGRIGANSYYKNKHPEWVVDGVVCRGEVFDLVTGTANELGDMIRKKYPKLKVSMIRPSGGVDGDPWTYVVKAFEKTGKHFNVFGVDCYLCYPYHIGPEIKRLGDIDGREWTWNRIRELIAKYGCGQRVFMSEASLRGDSRYLDESEWQRLRAEMMAKDFLICRALGMYSYYLFYALGGGPTSHYSFSMQQKHRMQIPLPAVCQAARLVENSVRTRYVRQPGAGRITLYKKHDGSGTAAIWAERGYFFQPADATALTVMDMMGNKIQPNQAGRYALDTAPVLISGAKYEVMENAILKGEIAQRDFCRICWDVKHKETLTVEAVNTSSRKDHPVRLELRSQAGSIRREFTLPAAGYRQFTLPASGPEAELSIRDLETGAVIEVKAKLETPIVLTGKPVRFAAITEQSQTSPNDPWAPWFGPDDLSAKAFAAWNERELLVEVQVKDDLHFVKQQWPWNCDSVQIALDPQSRGGFLKDPKSSVELNGTVHEVCVALDTKTGQQKRFFSYGRRDLLGDPDACVITRDEKTKQTLYRFRIPWAKLGVKPEKGRVFGMSLAIFDDDTGKGKEILAEIGGGIINGKDPRRYLKFVLE